MIERNLIPLEEKQRLYPAKKRVYQTSQNHLKPKACLCCCKKDYKSSDCKTITKDFKKTVSEKRLCFKCNGFKHRAAVAVEKPAKTSTSFVTL